MDLGWSRHKFVRIASIVGITAAVVVHGKLLWGMLPAIKGFVMFMVTYQLLMKVGIPVINNIVVGKIKKFAWRKAQDKPFCLQVCAKLGMLGGFPQQMGSFLLTPVPVLAHAYTVDQVKFCEDEDCEIWDISPESLKKLTRGLFRVELLSGGRSIRLRMSQRHKVIFGRFRRQQLGIPQCAEEMRWVYPNNGEIKFNMDRQNEDFQTVKNFLTIGGWLCFDRHLSLIQILTPNPLNYMVEEIDFLSFDPPKTLPKHAFDLVSEKRWQKITIEAMKKTGATHFCWLKPCEQFFDVRDGSLVKLAMEDVHSDEQQKNNKKKSRLLDSQPWIPHGGFAYRFDSSQVYTEPIYFAIQGFKMVASASQNAEEQNAMQEKALQGVAIELAKDCSCEALSTLMGKDGLVVRAEHAQLLNVLVDSRKFAVLHQAAYHCNRQFCETLLEKYADPTIRTRDGRTASQVIITEGVTNDLHLALNLSKAALAWTKLYGNNEQEEEGDEETTRTGIPTKEGQKRNSTKNIEADRVYDLLCWKDQIRFWVQEINKIDTLMQEGDRLYPDAPEDHWAKIEQIISSWEKSMPEKAYHAHGCTCRACERKLRDTINYVKVGGIEIGE